MEWQRTHDNDETSMTHAPNNMCKQMTRATQPFLHHIQTATFFIIFKQLHEIWPEINTIDA